MGKLIKKITVALIPLALALVFFFAFEPYDYFCLKGESAYLSKPLSSLRELLIKRPENVVLGASQMANLNTDYIEEISGESCVMLAFGGACGDETIDEFWYAAEHTELKKVVIGTNFYNMDGNRVGGRMENTEKLAENPFAFCAHFNYWLEAVNNCNNKLLDLAADAVGNEALRIHEDDPSSLTQADPEQTAETVEGYRRDLYEYSDTINRQCAGYGNYEQLIDGLLEIADYCDENGIELIFVFAPANRVIWDRVIYPNGLDAVIDRYKDALKRRAVCYDFELDGEFAAGDRNFIDGFHVVRENKLRMARILFAGEDPAGMCEVSAPEDYVALKGGTA